MVNEIIAGVAFFTEVGRGYSFDNFKISYEDLRRVIADGFRNDGQW